MSPELIDPERFGLDKSRPTTASDCYALGMVIYETISGKLPFHKDTDYTVSLKVVGGKRPSRGAKFSDNLWRILEQCWVSCSNDRPSIEDILQCLGAASGSSEPHASGSDGEIEMDSDDWDSSDGASSGISDTMTTTMCASTPFVSPAHSQIYSFPYNPFNANPAACRLNPYLLAVSRFPFSVSRFLDALPIRQLKAPSLH